MAGLNDLLYLSGSGLNAYQSQISVHGNNIANVGTEGYSRRSLELETARPAGETGAGVHAGGVSRLYNALGQNALLSELPNQGYHAQMASYLSDLESVVGGGNGEVNQALSAFRTALQDAIASPQDTAARTVLLQSASTLGTTLNRVDAAVQQVDALWGTAADVVDEINGLTTRLQSLNKEIAKAGAAGRSVPDLLDDRDQLVQELAGKANVAVAPDYRISLGGQELVSANGLAREELAAGAADTFSIAGTDVTASVTGGQLAARVAAGGTAATVRDQLDALAATLVSETNAVFGTAYNLNGERPADLGHTFFTGTAAADIAVDTALYDPADPMAAHPERVALAATRFSAGPPPIPNAGDNAAGQALYDALSGPLAGLDGQSLSGYWTQAETTLGGAVREESALAAGSATVVQMFENRMLSVSGVNLDEELMELMNAEKAYQASARLMSTANNLLETLMNI